MSKSKVMHSVRGCKLGTTEANIRYPNRQDLLLIALDKGSKVASSFTTNAFCAAPVTLAKQHLSSTEDIRYLLINSGNANAATGEQGLNDAVQCCQWVAEQFNVLPTQVLPFSTGVIGEHMPLDKFQQAIPTIALKADNWQQAACAIMTTDTVPKARSAQIRTPDGIITISGIAKGSGMINPQMSAPQATMLSYIATDAEINQEDLYKINQWTIEKSFNCITVDGDTSTNDACVLMATGQGVVIDNIDEGIGKIFTRALVELYQQLACDLVRDAEGATKFITIEVNGATSEQEAKNVAKSIAHSPLVKTAFFASDPNWGRIIAAIGYADVDSLDPNLVNVEIQSKDFVVPIVTAGERDSRYSEQQGQTIFNQSDITLRVELNRGDSTQTIWTSDLSHEYIEINASYRS